MLLRWFSWSKAKALWRLVKGGDGHHFHSIQTTNDRQTTEIDRCERGRWNVSWVVQVGLPSPCWPWWVEEKWFIQSVMCFHGNREEEWECVCVFAWELVRGGGKKTEEKKEKEKHGKKRGRDKEQPWLYFEEGFVLSQTRSLNPWGLTGKV